MATESAQKKDGPTAEQKEGHGTVPNVTLKEPKGKTEELKKAFHDLEEEKGDWSKDH